MYIDYTKEEIQQFENEIKEFFTKENINLVPGLDLVVTCRNLGFSMYSMTLPEKVDGLIYVKNDDKRIGVSNLLPLRDSRRVIAHELSHFIRKSKGMDGKELLFALKDNIFHDNKKSKEENEMDYMAAAILVPMDSFLNELKELKIKGLFSLEEVENRVDFKNIAYLTTVYDVDADLIKRRIVEACKYVA